MFSQYSSIEQFLKAIQICYQTNVDLKRKTWIHRGGVAGIYILPSSIEELAKVLKYCYYCKEKFEIVGHTSNLYFLNDYNPNIVITTILCNGYKHDNNLIICDCGAKVSSVAKYCVNEGIKGFEYLTMLPGTIGGAIYNNSSCYENSISKLVAEIEFLDENGEVRYYTSDMLAFSFRTSLLKQKRLRGVILRAILYAEKTDDADFLKSVSMHNEISRKKMLDGPAMNLGCTFSSVFVNGRMALRYSVPLKLYGFYLKIFCSETIRNRKAKEFILRITGYGDLIPYISDKLMITYIWKDEKADALFPRYLEFMRNIYKTESLEIEIKRE